MNYDDFSLPPIEQLNRINSEYQKQQKIIMQNFTSQKNIKILEDELRIIATACKEKFEWQHNFLQKLKQKTNYKYLIKHIEHLISENDFHFDKFKILYEEVLPVETTNIEEDIKIINKNYLLLIKDGIYNEVELIKLLLELKNYEAQTKLQTVITNLINNRLDFIKYISSLTDEFLKPNLTTFSFFPKRF